MTGKIDHYMFSLIMTLVTAGVGGLVMVIVWAQVLMEPTAQGDKKYQQALYALTAAVCIGTVGSAIATVLPESIENIFWTLMLLASFACAFGSAYAIRLGHGPGKRPLQLGATILFFADMVCIIGMVMAMPGFPLNQGGAP